MNYVPFRTARACALALLMTGPGAGSAQQVTVVNMIPISLSNETNRDSEPNVAVNPVNPQLIAASAFTPDPAGSGNGPIFVSTDGGNTWALIIKLPGGNRTVDVTLRFGTTSGVLYAGILRRDNTNLNILRTNNFLAPGLMTVLVNQPNDDQPWVEAVSTTLGTGVAVDRVYLGENALSLFPGRTATVYQSLNAATLPAPAGFAPVRIEARNNCAQDGPSIRPAIHPDGTIYAAFFRWTACATAPFTADVVVVRDGNWGTGTPQYAALLDGSDGQAGRLVATGVQIPWGMTLGTQRIGSQLAIAVDPRSSRTVYVSWADGTTGNNYTVRVRRSNDGGVTWTGDLRSITPATNPGLAITTEGKVGFLYQQLTGSTPTQRWETHLELSDDGFATTPTDLILADVPDANGSYTGTNPIGDYTNLVAVGERLYGVFSANNTPNSANFPNGVRYQRNVNFGTNTLLGVDSITPVPVSIDPFFFAVAQEVPEFEYAAKLICGVQRDPRDMRLTRGFYGTAISIHNPNDSTVVFFKKLALTFPPEEQRAGRVIPIAYDTLRTDEALEVDCMDILRRLFPNGFPLGYIKGFVVIQSPASLDVTAVYTASSLDREGNVVGHSSIDVEQIRERRKERVTPPPPPTEELDHFKVYEVGTVPVNLRVRLTDQLDTVPKAVSLDSLTHFANPTRKVHAGAPVSEMDTVRHLNWYAISQPQPEPRRTIRYLNQFGQHSVNIRDPRFLLVPTQKTSIEGSAFPDDLDHYKCYEVIAVNTMPDLPVVMLDDQFGSGQSVQVGKPRYFCLPAIKETGTAVPRDIVNAEYHLAVYDITPETREREISVRDQFGERRLNVRRSVLLAVPTTKQAVVTHEN